MALIFDVDGTLADTEGAHREAFNEAFAAAGLPWQWSEAEYIRLLAVAGGRERIARSWQEREPGLLLDDERRATIARLHADKTRRYEARVGQGQVPLRPGVRRLIDEARAAGHPLAIATTTTPANIDALLRTPFGPGWRSLFAAIGDGDSAPRKKPDPEVYLQVMAALGRDPEACVALEDSGNGLRAARAAGLRVIITPTSFTAGDDFTGALAVLPDLSSLRLPALLSLLG